MKLQYERGALADLDKLFAYIAADNREAAARLVARIETAAAKIAATPYYGRGDAQVQIPTISGRQLFDRV